jgi:two-component system, NarL family, nitrate/nitrite response regulator NarL
MSLPIIVTHPSTLFHNGLRQLFAKSRFRPVRIATSLNEELESYLKSQASCVWLTGVETSVPATTALVRKVVDANPGVKAVILAASQEPENIAAALKAGACGFLCQDIPGERLLRSLELIALGEMVVHPQFAWNPPANENHTNGHGEDRDCFLARAGAPHVIQRLGSRSALSGSSEESASEAPAGEAVPPLSRREMLILRMLTQGASNKVIARNLVITESTVKVHMKAILRKLRLQNRTQAAIWARNNVNEGDWNARAMGAVSAGAAH